MKPESDNPGNLIVRTRRFALDSIELYSALPKTTVAQVLGKQFLRSATSVGAHYREAQRAKSILDFVSKIEGALQELDEAAYWIELLVESGNLQAQQYDARRAEIEELIAIFVTIAKSAKNTSIKKIQRLK
jgi:four helix bundle protein